MRHSRTIFPGHSARWIAILLPLLPLLVSPASASLEDGVPGARLITSAAAAPSQGEGFDVGQLSGQR